MKDFDVIQKTLHDVQDKILTIAEGEKRNLTNAEDAAFIQSQALALEAKTLSERTARSIPIPPAARGEAIADDGAKVFGGVGLSYRKLFYNDERVGLDRSRSAESYLREVLEKRTMLGSVGELGGATVPEYFWANIHQSVMSTAICLPRCMQFPMQGMSMHIAAHDSEDQSRGFFGNVEMEWVGEAGTFTAKTPKTRSIKLTAFKAGLYVNCSQEVIEDSNTLEGSLGPMMVYGVGQGIDEAVLNGSGVGMPQGILDAGATVVYTRAGASAITFADVVGMLSRLHPFFWSGAIWISHPSCIPQLANLRDAGNNNLWVSAQGGGAAAGLPAALFGIPLVFSDKVPALGAKGDLTLANFSAYALGLRKEASVEMTNAAYWTQNLLSFRCIMRMDGKPLLDNPITPRTGGATLSAFVTLE